MTSAQNTGWGAWTCWGVGWGLWLHRSCYAVGIKITWEVRILFKTIKTRPPKMKGWISLLELLCKWCYRQKWGSRNFWALHQLAAWTKAACVECIPYYTWTSTYSFLSVSLGFVVRNGPSAMKQLWHLMHVVAIVVRKVCRQLIRASYFYEFSIGLEEH